MYEYGLIGNCQISALIGVDGAVEWLCMPRPDSPPVFGRLLDPDGGVLSSGPAEGGRGTQSYIPNTNILVTRFGGVDGSEFTITDFCPRFEQYGRIYRPTSMFRIVRPMRGSPWVRMSCHPVNGWEKSHEAFVRGNSHLRWDMRGDALRITTNMSLTYLAEATPFVLQEPVYLALSWGSGIEAELPTTAEEFLEHTIRYWRSWVKHCTIPTHFQHETIRSALILKLHCYEDTGAILAALTTSLPEIPGRERNWDYRFCWLRDAYFCLSAFHNLGHFEEMEGFLKFLINILHGGDRLSPVYTLDHLRPIPEELHANWRGWRDSRPVRSFNQAGEHVQNDVYGELILALSPIFLDERFQHLRGPDLLHLVSILARRCCECIGVPDAGLWEIRGSLQEHSFTNLMCWAGLARARQILGPHVASSLLAEIDRGLQKARARLYAAVVAGSLRNGPHDDTVDASLLLLSVLHFPDERLSRATVERIAAQLVALKRPGRSGFLYRYKRADDFGVPESSFVICSYWLVHAYARLGQLEKARSCLLEVLRSANGLGLMSEHFDPEHEQQLGNFPQAYSHVGLINAAFVVSPRWTDVF